jgi:GMP synthase (glutamine-hydrolysing)
MRTLLVNCYRQEPEEKIGNFIKLVEKFSGSEVIADRAINPTFDVSRFGALVLSGSSALVGAGEYYENFILFLRRVRLPVLGVCYGLQILAKAFGGVVTKGELVSKNDEKITITADDPLFTGLGKELTAVENHYEYVEESSLKGADFHLLAHSDSCPVEAIRHKRQPLYGVQFHLERSGELGRQIMANFYGFIVKPKNLLLDKS